MELIKVINLVESRDIIETRYLMRLAYFATNKGLLLKQEHYICEYVKLKVHIYLSLRVCVYSSKDNFLLTMMMVVVST